MMEFTLRFVIFCVVLYKRRYENDRISKSMNENRGSLPKSSSRSGQFAGQSITSHGLNFLIHHVDCSKRSQHDPSCVPGSHCPCPFKPLDQLVSRLCGGAKRCAIIRCPLAVWYLTAIIMVRTPSCLCTTPSSFDFNPPPITLLIAATLERFDHVILETTATEFLKLDTCIP